MHNYKKIRDTGIISLEDKLVEAKGRPSGFDYMRLILAISVVSFHAIIISYGGATLISVWASHWRIALALILPMFFSLSGFLVAGSLERSKTLITFLGLTNFANCSSPSWGSHTIRPHFRTACYHQFI